MRCDLSQDLGEAWTLYMRRGDFAAAWRLSDTVLRARRDFRCEHLPRHFQWVWDGRSLEGKRVLIRCYHGLGDTVHFIRYAPLVRAVAAEVTVLAQSELIPLLSSVGGIDRLLPLEGGDVKPGYDVDVEVMELPHVFRTTLDTIPAQIPYIYATNAMADRNGQSAKRAAKKQVEVKVEFRRGADKPKEHSAMHSGSLLSAGGRRETGDRVAHSPSPVGRGKGEGSLAPCAMRHAPPASQGKLCVGIVWAAGDWDRRRSIPASFLAPLANVPGVELQIFQLGEALTEPRKWHAVMPQWSDIVMEATLIRALDLMISIDSLPAHLAGALGVPVWALLQKEADWRWMEGRDDSPWYPTMRLFRQERAGEWPPVIAAVAAELERLSAAHSVASKGEKILTATNAKAQSRGRS